MMKVEYAVGQVLLKVTDEDPIIPFGSLQPVINFSLKEIPEGWVELPQGEPIPEGEERLRALFGETYPDFRATVLTSGATDLQPQPGVLHPVDQAFYDLAVKERDFERQRVDRQTATIQSLQERLVDAEEIIFRFATAKRSDGTYNYSREAAEQQCKAWVEKYY